MPLENFNIRRACLHEVFRRSDNRAIRAPTLATSLLTLDERGRDVFESRVLAAFRSGAKCMQMRIASHGPGSALDVGHALSEASDSVFIAESQKFASKLADVQVSRQYPGGLVVVFDGSVGHPAKPYFAVMKAELHDAFLKGSNLQATFVDSVFLSPKTRLYKIGIFVSETTKPAPSPTNWSAVVYDSQLTASARESAALYFHQTFLGLDFPENSAHQTKRFYTTTREFINSAAISESQKVDLYNSLYSYLKLDRSPTIQISTFSDTFMDEQLNDDYRRYMRKNRFTDEIMTKDISEIAGQMRIRKFRFRDKITLSGPAEAITNLVNIETISSPEGERWTRIVVQSPLEGQQ